MDSNTPTEKPTNAGRVVAKLSDAACRWAAGLYDPRTTIEEVSVPHGVQLSQKVKTFVRGSFSTGTTGIGYINLAPYAMLTNNVAPGIWTTAGSAGTASDQQTTFTGQAGNTVFANSTFSNANFGTSSLLLSFKLSGCALYVKYAGTELNRGGDMILLEQPDHRTVYNTSYTNALGFDFAKRVSVKNEWQHVCYTPNSDAECEFSGDINAKISPLVPFLTIWVNSAGAPQPFDFEFFCNFEVVGQTARSATLSFEDPIGYSAVVGAANQFQQLDSVLGADGFIHSMEDQLENMSGIARNATHRQNWAALASFLPMLANIATNALSGAASGAMKGMGVKVKKTKEQKERKLVKAEKLVSKKAPRSK